VKRGAGVLVAGAFFGVSALFVAVAVHDQAARCEVWAVAAPLMDWLVAAGAAIASRFGPLTVGVATALTALLCWAALGRAAGRFAPTRWLISGLVAATWGQVALVLRHPTAGAGLWLVGGGLAAFGLIKVARTDATAWRNAAPRTAVWDRTDVLALVLLILVAALFRFYQLDRIVDYFEGELAPYYAGATSLHGMWLADAGKNGPWAPLHLSFYLPVWLTTHLLGSTVLSIRVAAALVSLASVPLLYAVARRVGGRPAALLATSFFVLDPLQIGWGRSDVHPHASTLWAPLIVCLALFRAEERRRPLDFALLALAMGASWQTYPSGQSAVLIPVFVFGTAYLTRSPRIRRLGFKPLLAVVSGLALWAASIPLPWLIASHRWRFPDLVHEFGNRTSWDAAPVHALSDALLQILHLTGRNTLELLSGLFYRVPNLFHQTFLPTAPDFLQRSLNWTALPFAVLGICLACLVPTLRRSRVVLAWAIAAVLPSVLSSEGYVKRAATLYPALLVLGGVGFSVLWYWATQHRRALRLAVSATAIVAFSCLAALQSFLWFSGANYPAGTPGIEVSLRSLRPYLGPGTIAVLDPSHPNLPAMTTYLLLDTLAEKDRFPVAWIPCADDVAPFPRLLEDPASGLSSLPRTPWYTWTKLRPLIHPLRGIKDWKRAVFLFQTVVHGEQQPPAIADLQEALRRYPRSRVSELAGPNPDYQLTVVVVDLQPEKAGVPPEPVGPRHP
jgi:Dolichyl-phosphate-mannose-protein mannosyltransferase